MTEPSKPEKSSNVTESTGKVCSACEEKRLKTAFSKKQWLEPAASRRCSECVTANKPTKAAPQPASAATATSATAQPAKSTASTAGSVSSLTTANPSSSSSPPTSATTASPATAAASSQPGPKLRPNKTVPHAIVQPKRNAKRPPLLDNDGDWFLPTAEAALVEIFNRFDADRDGQWTIRETQSFATATNGKPFTTEELYEVTNHFFKDNKLPRHGFLQFYHLQTSSHPAETWKDLQRLGYGWEQKTGRIVPVDVPVKQVESSGGEGGTGSAVAAETSAAAATTAAAS